MGAYSISLVSATLLCSLVAGFLFAFACVVMPGIGTLDDRGFLRSFQVVDQVIQNNQPLFMPVWVGSVLTLVITTAIGLGRLAGFDRALLLLAAVIYFGGVQLPTVAINVPLNNRLQTLDVETADDAVLAGARDDFESLWNRWNQIRTVLATLTSVLLIVLALRL